MDFKLELIGVPVTDVDRAIEFYVERCGFNLDHDHTVSRRSAAREQLAGRGVEVSEVQEFPWGRFVFFKDPDGNGWSVQQIVPQDQPS